MSGLGTRLFADADVDARLAAQPGRRSYEALGCVGAGRAHHSIPDEAPLEFAAAQQRAILTHTIADFMALAQAWQNQGREHHGIVVVEHIPLGDLIRRTALHLDTVPPDDQYNALLYLTS